MPIDAIWLDIIRILPKKLMDNLQVCKTSITRHNNEIHKNLKAWRRKPLLQLIYRDFYKLLSDNLQYGIKGPIVEIGSGIGSLKEIIPNCVCTDIFGNPWVDRIENVYDLSFEDEEISNVIMFDVFHHIRYPGTALDEIRRTLCNNGRLIIFEPYISLLGLLVYGLMHDEPINMRKDISWHAPEDFDIAKDTYYAAQGNAMRIFVTNKYRELLRDWKQVVNKRISSVSYIASGGFSKPQLYPVCLYPAMKLVDRCCNLLPWLFATRILVVLEKQ